MPSAVSPPHLVHLIDDEQPVRQMLSLMLTGAGFAVQSYSSADDFVREFDSAAPGCILTDIRMAGLTGIQLITFIKQSNRRFPVIVMSGSADIPLVVEAMRVGAVDFLPKPFQRQALLSSLNAAIEETGAGASPSSVRQFGQDTLFATLSPRQRDVLEGVLQGKPNKTIGHDLGISARTVEVYRAGVMSKTQSRNLSELVRSATLAREA